MVAALHGPPSWLMQLPHMTDAQSLLLVCQCAGASKKTLRSYNPYDESVLAEVCPYAYADSRPPSVCSLARAWPHVMVAFASAFDNARYMCY